MGAKAEMGLMANQLAVFGSVICHYANRDPLGGDARLAYVTRIIN
jgi:hypothetical protein